MPDASAAALSGMGIETKCDVFVAGGGPAGSTMAALLAERGFDVALADKDVHPRFHIGESLLPYNVPLFEKLGVADEVKRIGMLKLGIEFVSPYHEKGTQCLEFGRSWDKAKSYSYQVRRSEFDHILLKNAAAKGALVSEGCHITDVEFPVEGGAVVAGRDAAGNACTWRAKFFVDATGRETLLAGKMQLKRRNRRNNSAAIYGHFAGAQRLEGDKEGNISIFWFDGGWIWFIPLSDGTTSIGAVCRPEYIKTRKTDLTQFLHDTIALAPPLARRLEHAQLMGEPTATGNYSYISSRMAGPSYLMVGDAFAFVDPVFSSGVYLAMRSASLGADVVTECLRTPANAERAKRRFARDVRYAIKTFSWFIYRINRPAIRNLFMNPQNILRMEEAVLSLLAGDVSPRSPIHARLRLFKGVYYMNAAILKLRGIEPEAVQNRQAAPMAKEAAEREAA